MKKVKVADIEGVPIYFHPVSERFSVNKGDDQYDSLHSAKRAVLRDKETAFEGEFFIHDPWNGIVKFTAKRRIFNEYDGTYNIVGEKQKGVGINRTELKEEALFPISPENTALYEQSHQMDRDGWKMIDDAKRLGVNLKKSSL